jgi:hypothetical protein
VAHPGIAGGSPCGGIPAMTHSHSLDFRGDLAAAFSMATSTLTACGFNLVNKTSRSLEFTSPGMWNSHQNPLLGASRITLTGGVGRIELQAELGGSRGVVVLFGVVAVIGVVQAVGFGLAASHSTRAFNWAQAAPIAIVLLFGALGGPLGFYYLRQRTLRSLNTLLNNMVMSGKDT